MSVIAALLPNPTRQARLRSAVRSGHTVTVCDDWVALTRACEEQPVYLAVLDLFAFGAMALEPLRHLKRRFPRLATVAYVACPPERARDLFDAGRAGVDALVIADRDDEPSVMSDILERAAARSIATLVRDRLSHVRPTARDAALVAVTRAHARLTTESLARSVALSRRMLAKQLERATLPSPQRLLTWGRLVVAAHMLEDPNRSADGVALALHFPSGSAFRNTCQRYLHATPSEIRQAGGADMVIRAMLSDQAPERSRLEAAAAD